MGRETLLTILLLLLGGLATQPLALLPYRRRGEQAPHIAERRAWLRLWLPVVPTLVVGAWLCGWALREPDPVRDHLDRGMLVAACLPFAVIAIRALLRAVWSLVREPADTPICTVGFLHPRILFSPLLARTLDEEQMRAAWEHERAHARHRDPLRIWLAQIATDLQWPWPWGREYFETWLEVLECTRDEEARYCGASGVDLAAAVLATVRQSSSASLARGGGGRAGPVAGASLIGDSRALQRRIARLLAPLPEHGDTPSQMRTGSKILMTALFGMLVAACVLGAIYGESVIHPLLAWTWTV
jgi:hypothetical protein